MGGSDVGEGAQPDDEAGDSMCLEPASWHDSQALPVHLAFLTPWSTAMWGLFWNDVKISS